MSLLNEATKAPEVGSDQPVLGTQTVGSAPDVTVDTSTEDLLGGKYKTAGDLAKAYTEQSKYISDLRNSTKELEDKYKVPDAYEFDFESDETLKEYTDVVEGSKDEYDKLLGIFKENGLTQAQAKGILTEYLKAGNSSEVSVESELEKLGPKKDEILGGLTNYANSLDDSDKAILESLAFTADGVKFLHKHLVGETPKIPTGASAVSSKSSQELFDEAFAYEAKHKATISGNDGQQKHYKMLMKKAFDAQESEKK